MIRAKSVIYEILSTVTHSMDADLCISGTILNKTFQTSSTITAILQVENVYQHELLSYYTHSKKATKTFNYFLIFNLILLG